MRCQRPTKRPKHKPCETQARFLPPLLLVGSKELVLKVPQRWQFDAAIRVRKEPREREGIAAKLLRCGIASEALRRNMPLSSGKIRNPNPNFLVRIFSCGAVFHVRGGRAKKFGMSFETQGNFWVGCPGILPVYPGGSPLTKRRNFAQQLLQSPCTSDSFASKKLCPIGHNFLL